MAADGAMRALCTSWLQQLDRAAKHKEEVFGRDAEESTRFFRGPYNFLYRNQFAMAGQEIDFPAPTFQMTLNKSFEAVKLFGPTLYHDNPVRTVTPRQPVQFPLELFPDPQYFQAVFQEEMANHTIDAFQAQLLAAYLNATPVDLDLRTHSRLAVDEAIIKGRGTIWTEIYQPPSADFRRVGSFYDSVDNLLVDPDAETMEDAWWVARRRVHPVWQVERLYGLKPGSVKGNFESIAQQVSVDSADDGPFRRRKGQTNDLLVYYQVYSKMGIGGRLKGLNPDHKAPLEVFGDECFLAVARGVNYPLNLPPEFQERVRAGQVAPEEATSRAGWPTPFWARHGLWPVACLDFNPVPRQAWPMSLMKAGMGELKFLNWGYSFAASRVRRACRDLVVTRKGLAENVKTTLIEGEDLELLELETDEDVQRVMQVLQFPQMNKDLFEVLQMVERNFEKRTGLNELLYGVSNVQLRSAEEAQLKGANLQIRPDDMRKQAEAWMTKVAAMEGLAARWHLGAHDVIPVLGSVAGQAWQQFVATQDLHAAAWDLEYRIEAGSAARPNKEKQVANAQQAVTLFFAPFFQFAQATGQLGPLNNLIADYCAAMDLEPARYQLPVPPPAPPPPASGGKSGPSGRNGSAPANGRAAPNPALAGAPGGSP